MRIACDARPLLGRAHRRRRLARGLLRGLAAPHRLATSCWPSAAPREDARPRRPRRPRRSMLAPPVPAARDALAAHPGRAARSPAGPTSTWRTLGILPRRLAMPGALVVHDLTPITRPRHHTLANRFCFSRLLRRVARAGGRRWCATRRRPGGASSALLPRQAERPRVVPLAVDRVLLSGPAARRTPQRPAAASRRGGRSWSSSAPSSPRKGIATLLAAHASLSSRRSQRLPDLVLAGGRGWGGALARAGPCAPTTIPERVHLPGYVTREEARALLRHAEAVVLASEEEGFGLPLAEALACGAPCVVSRRARPRSRWPRGPPGVFRRGDAAGLAGRARPHPGRGSRPSARGQPRARPPPELGRPCRRLGGPSLRARGKTVISDQWSVVRGLASPPVIDSSDH